MTRAMRANPALNVGQPANFTDENGRYVGEGVICGAIFDPAPDGSETLILSIRIETPDGPRVFQGRARQFGPA